MKNVFSYFFWNAYDNDVIYDGLQFKYSNMVAIDRNQ